MSTQALAIAEPDELIRRVAEGRFTPTESAMLHRLVKLRPNQKPPIREELALVVSEAMHLGLDPFAGQCYFINYGDAWQTYPHWSGLLKIAEDTGEYQGHDGPFYSDDGATWAEAWVPDTPPRFARVVVYRRGHQPKVAVAKWVRANKGTPNWKSDPEGMLGKSALRLAIRMAFPKQIGSPSLALSEEADDEPMSDDQRRAIFAQLHDLDMGDRSERLGWASDVLGRTVESFTTLTRSDAIALLDWLASAIPSAAALKQAGGVGESTVTGSGRDPSSADPPVLDDEPHREWTERTDSASVPVRRQPATGTTAGASATMRLASAVPRVSEAVEGGWQRADPASPGEPSTAEGSLAEGAVVVSTDDPDRRTELVFRIAAAYSEWHRSMPKGATAWLNGFLAHVKRSDLNECELEELEAGWDWLVALNRAK